MKGYLKNLVDLDKCDCQEDQLEGLSEKKTAYINNVRKLTNFAIKSSCVLGLALAGGGASMLLNLNGGENSLSEIATFSAVGAGWGALLGNFVCDKVIDGIVGKAYNKFDKVASDELGCEVSVPVQINQKDIEDYEKSAELLPGIYNPSNYVDSDNIME